MSPSYLVQHGSRGNYYVSRSMVVCKTICANGKPAGCAVSRLSGPSLILFQANARPKESVILSITHHSSHSASCEKSCVPHCLLGKDAFSILLWAEARL